MTVIGACGDNCFYCPRYIATQNGTADDLEKVKELWVRLELRDPAFPAQDLVCQGCRPENQCAYSELRACARAREMDTCGSCRDYPCERINNAFEQSEIVRTRAIRVCTPEELEALEKAFFSKAINLNRIHFGED